MEAYTNIKIEMENNEVAIKAVEKVKRVIMKDSVYKEDEKYIELFLNDIYVSEGRIIVNDTYTLDSVQFNHIVPLIMKTIATLNEVKTFEGNANHTSCNCGYESYIDGNYWNEVLTIESVESENFYGECDECGEFIVHFEDYDPNMTYVCKDCGKVLTAEEMFPEGVPEVKVECYDIW